MNRHFKPSTGRNGKHVYRRKFTEDKEIDVNDVEALFDQFLSAYAFGQIIEFQLENYLNGKDFANEVSRIFKQGRLTTNVWIKQATANDLTVAPMLEALR